MSIPFADLLGIRFGDSGDGRSHCELTLAPSHLNSLGGAHGGVAFTLADTGMGAAVRTVLERGQGCATIELKINYLRPAAGAAMRCESTVIHKGRTMASVESRVLVDDELVAVALGTFAILSARPAPPG